MLLEDSGREALFYHRLQISHRPVTILAADMPELKETLEVICSNLLLYSLIHSTNIYLALTV